MTQKKFSEEHLAMLKSLNQRYADLYYAIGQNTVRLREVKSEEEALMQQHTSLFEEEKSLAKTLKDSYGEGVIDLVEGTITVA